MLNSSINLERLFYIRACGSRQFALRYGHKILSIGLESDLRVELEGYLKIIKPLISRMIADPKLAVGAVTGWFEFKSNADDLGDIAGGANGIADALIDTQGVSFKVMELIAAEIALNEIAKGQREKEREEDERYEDVLDAHVPSRLRP